MFFSEKGGTVNESFLLTRKETVYYAGPCLACGKRFPEPISILGNRNGPLNQANYSSMKCCEGPVCSSCSQRQKAGKRSHPVQQHCLFCSKDGEKKDVVTTRQIGGDKGHERTSIEWTIDFAEPLSSFESASLQMPYLIPFLKSMPASQRLSLKISWRTMKDQRVRDLYDLFLQRSHHLWRSFFARKLTFNAIDIQCEQQPAHRFLFSNRMVNRCSWLTRKKVGPCAHHFDIITKSVQRIPPEFICFCIRQMVGSFNNSAQKKKFFEETFKRVLSKFFFGSEVSLASHHPFAH
jgi:hypothetical protein